MTSNIADTMVNMNRQDQSTVHGEFHEVPPHIAHQYSSYSQVVLLLSSYESAHVLAFVAAFSSVTARYVWYKYWALYHGKWSFPWYVTILRTSRAHETYKCFSIHKQIDFHDAICISLDTFPQCSTASAATGTVHLLRLTLTHSLSVDNRWRRLIKTSVNAWRQHASYLIFLHHLFVNQQKVEESRLQSVIHAVIVSNWYGDQLTWNNFTAHPLCGS